MMIRECRDGTADGIPYESRTNLPNYHVHGLAVVRPHCMTRGTCLDEGEDVVGTKYPMTEFKFRKESDHVKRISCMFHGSAKLERCCEDDGVTTHDTLALRNVKVMTKSFGAELPELPSGDNPIHRASVLKVQVVETTKKRATTSGLLGLTG